jgi:hypothetical protein
MLRRLALVRTDVSEEPGASFIRVTRICELGTTQAATSNRRTLRRNGCTGVTMKNAGLWDIKSHFVPHRKHITTPVHNTSC